MKQSDFADFVRTWNGEQAFETPMLHEQIVDWLTDNWIGGRRELLLLAFRNCGKSTLVGLFAAWLLKCDPALRIVVLAADHALAKKMVRNVKRIIERHPMCEGMKPTRADQWASAQFTVNRDIELRDPSMLARGISANVTGSRADIVICDDVEVPNTCNSADKRESLRERLGEIEYVLVPGGLQLYVGTPHTHDSIYLDEAAVPDINVYLDGFDRLELALLDKKGNSRWPERFPQEKIESIKKRSGPNKFASQMMLKPVNIVDGRLDPDLLRHYDVELDYREGNGVSTLTLGDRRMVSASCWWDPSYGSPDRGDASVVACIFTDDRGDYWLHRVRYLEHDPTLAETEAEAIQMCRQVARFLRTFQLPSVIVETNGIGRFLPGLLKKEIRELGLNAAVIEKATRVAKERRIIEAFDVVLAAGSLYAHRSIWETPFITEMREWRPGSGGADDGLDAVSGCLLSEPVRLARHAPVATDIKPHADWQRGSGGFRAKTDFSL